jgi:hypothetical protein
MLALVVSVLLVYVGLEHVKPKLLKLACIFAGGYESLLLLAGLAHHLLHN